MYDVILGLLVTALGAIEGTTLFVVLEVVATLFCLFLIFLPVAVFAGVLTFILRLIRR